MTVPFLINPSAGTAALLDAALDRLTPEERAQLAPKRCAPEEMKAALQEAIAGGATRIVVGGGDGTLRMAAPILAETGVTLGIVPLGTANLLARDLDLPSDPAAALSVALGSQTRRIALATVNGRPFFVGALIGRASHAASRLRERARKMRVPGLVSGALATISTWTRISPEPLAVVVDDRAHRVRSRAIAVVLGEVAGRPGQAFRREGLGSGPLTVYAAPVSAAALALGVGGQLLASVPAGSRPVRLETWMIGRAQSVVVTKPRRRIHVTLDGEPRLLSSPLRFRVDPEALEVAAPAPPSDDG